MPIDWEQFGNEIDAAIGNAVERTDERLAAQASSLTRLTDEEVAELFPTPADVKKLQQLMAIVKSAEDQNTKVTRLVTNIEDLAQTAIVLLSKFA